MANLAGARTSANTTSTNKAVDIDPVMTYVQDYMTPIQQYFIMSKSGSQPTKQSRSAFSWHTKTPLSRTNTLTAGLSGGSTTESSVALGTSTNLKFGDTFLVESSGEMLQVTSTGNTTTVNVRKVGAGNITAVSAGATVRIINNAVKEDYARTETISNNATLVTGYCQIGLDGVQMSGREDAEDKYTSGESFSDLMKEKNTEISKYEERKWIYNGASYDDSSANITHSAGFRGVITSNVKYYSGALDKVELDDMLEQLFAQQNTNELFGYAGTKYIRDLDKIMKDEHQYTVSNGDIIKSYGGLSKSAGSADILKYKSPWGTVNFMWNPMLEGDTYSKAALILNRTQVKMRYMKNDSVGSRKYRVEPDVQDNGSGVIFDQIMWDTGLQWGYEAYHGWHLAS